MSLMNSSMLRPRLGWLHWAAFGVLLAVVLVAVLALVVRGGGAGPPAASGETGAGPEGPPVPPETAGAGMTLTLAELAAGTDPASTPPAPLDGLLLVLVREGPAPRLEAVDGATGKVTARRETSWEPDAVRRRSAGEVLVSDLGVRQTAAGPVSSPRLLVLDAAHGLAVKRSIPMPNRQRTTTSWPLMALSGDERYLFYLAQESACSGDAAVCDGHSVAVLNLERPDQAPAVVPLPQNCGPAALLPLGQSHVLATCTNRAVLQMIDAGGRTLQTVDLGGHVGLDTDVPTTRRNPIRPQFGFVTPAGEPGVVLADGTLLWQTAAGGVQRLDALPAGLRAVPGQVAQPDARTLVVPYYTYGASTVEGVKVVDLARREVVRDVPLSGAKHVAPSGAQLLVLGTDGGVTWVPVTPGGTAQPAAGVSSEAEVLVP